MIRCVTWNPLQIQINLNRFTMNRLCLQVSRRGYASAATSTFRAADTIIQRTERGKPKPDSDKLVFGASYSDHMLTIKHSTQSGWEKPVIGPLKDLSIHPGAKVLHYATEVSGTAGHEIGIAVLWLFEDLRRHESLSRQRWEDTLVSSGFKHETNALIRRTKRSAGQSATTGRKR
jgi:hypothetical protein